MVKSVRPLHERVIIIIYVGYYNRSGMILQ